MRIRLIRLNNRTRFPLRQPTAFLSARSQSTALLLSLAQFVDLAL